MSFLVIAPLTFHATEVVAGITKALLSEEKLFLRSSSTFRFKSLTQASTRVLVKKWLVAQLRTPDNVATYLLLQAQEIQRLSAKSGPWLWFVDFFVAYEMWLGEARWTDNSHMHLLLKYQVYKPVSILLSNFIGWQTTTSPATGKSRLHTLWKKRRMQAPAMMLMSVKRCQGCKRQETPFLYECLHSWISVTNRRATSRVSEIFESL